MIELKYMVVATFVAENVKSPTGKLLIGSHATFYCGDNEADARLIFLKLPNPDKKIMFAKVYKTNAGMIERYEKINEL